MNSWITRGLTTAQGTNILALLLGIFEFGKAKVPDNHAEAFTYVMAGIAMFTLWVTRGHEAVPAGVDEPIDDVDHDHPLDEVLNQGRTLMSISPRPVSQRGIDLIKSFEGCKLRAYWDKWGKVWTIGYGWTHGVKRGDVWTQAKAEQMLTEGVKPYAEAVHAAIGNTPTTQDQFDAMTSFTYNVGPANFRKSSVLRYHLQGNRTAAGNAFLAWNKSGGKVLPGLTRRRQAEKALYLS